MEGRHESLWIASRQEGLSAHPLDADTQSDVVVVGGGMVGLITAHLLQEQGKQVVVLEAGSILHGVTGHTTAKVTSQHGTIYHKLADRFGMDAARTHAEANEQARGWITQTAGRLHADARLQSAPAYVYATTADEAQMLRREADAATQAGVPMQFVTETELPFPVEGAIRLDGQAHFHPLHFLDAVARAFLDNGGRIHQDTRVLEVDDGTPCTVRTRDAEVRADEVIIATNVPINDVAYFVTRMKPSRAYGIAVRTRGQPLQGMYISAGSPVRSVRPFESDEGPMLVIVGERHPVGKSEDTRQHFQALIDFARKHFPVESVANRWSTQDVYPVDDLPFIGRVSPRAKHVWTATGFRGWGMTQGVVASMILQDAALGRRHPWADLYDPFSAKRMAKELGGTAKLQAHVARKFVSGRLGSEDASLAPGEGAVKKIDGQRVAVHRDHDGRVHRRSATCTHMGCVVAWNQAEQSWDCPCHGSRFAGDGKVVHSPATRPLAEVEQAPETGPAGTS